MADHDETWWSLMGQWWEKFWLMMTSGQVVANDSFWPIVVHINSLTSG